MKTTSITVLVLLIVALALPATLAGILSNEGPGHYDYQSIRGETVIIWGKGIYQHMSKELAPQGIAQDYVTLIIGIPMLLISLYLTRKGLNKGRLLLAGTLGYFLVTYLFFMIMGMYNQFFLAYVILTGLSFFALMLMLLSFDVKKMPQAYSSKFPARILGGFLVFNSLAIAMLWLQVVVPPVLSGTFPQEVEHYTTLIVQGMDLSILLPLSFIAGLMLLKKKPLGYLAAPVYINFLYILMTALTGKIISQFFIGVEVPVPVITVISVFNLTTIITAILVTRSVKEDQELNAAA